MSAGRGDRAERLLDALKTEHAALLAERDDIRERIRNVEGAIKAMGAPQRPSTRAHDFDGPRARMRRLLAARPPEVVTAATAYELLVADGWTSESEDPVNVVRDVLSQLHKNGDVRKVSRGRYEWITGTDVVRRDCEATV